MLNFSLEKERADLGVFLYREEVRKIAFPTVTLGLCGFLQRSRRQCFRSEKQLLVRRATTPLSRTGGPVG